MKRRSKSNVFNDICDQPYSGLVKIRLYNSTKNSRCMLSRLSLTTRLPLHTGCVNTVSWDETGRLLLSGADDQRLVITQGHTWKPVSEVTTRHRANIFGAAFLPAADSKVVSCAGDGSVIYTDLSRQSETRDCLFSCHSGTTYQVAVVPGDAHSFLSCGEDGTVRCHDLRIKNSCARQHCSEDILVQCPKAVTSMSINSAAPYQLAVGSADSHIRLFDRRMIYEGGELRPTVAFTAPGLTSRGHRITSLSFAPEGQALLASFLSDHIFLFDIRDASCKVLSTSGMEDCAIPRAKHRCRPDGPEASVLSNLPMRRLRLRGDWSDTGPDARPESEGGRNDNVSDLSQGGSNQHSLMQRLTDVLSRMLTDPATRAALNEGRRSPPDEAPAALPVAAPVAPVAEATRRMHQIAQQWRRLSITARHQHAIPSNSQQMAPPNAENVDVLREASTSSSDVLPPSSESSSLENLTRTTKHTPAVTNKITNPSTSSGLGIDESPGISSIPRTNPELGTPSDPGIRREQGISLDPRTSLQPGTSFQPQPNVEPGASCEPGVGLESESRQSRATQTGSSQQPAASNTTQQDDYQTLAEAWMNQGDPEQEASDQETGHDDEELGTGFPIMQVFKGHRNSRTMIKQACFWGSDHVMSGSDCGHIFAWRRDNGHLVALFPGDLHVVNCLQPHPTLPLLASSGIDHDVKIWAPTAEKTTFDQTFADNLMQRNQVMLEETRDTITVPASFMIRMLACLNQMHRGGRTPRRPTQDDAE